MILSIDPGTGKTGVAVFTGPNPAVSTFVELTPGRADALLEWCHAKATERGEVLTVVVEDQYAEIIWVRGKPTVDFKSLLKLTRSAEIWVVLARRRGIRVVRVLGSTWQSKMLKGAKPAKNKARATKQAATKVFAETWPEVYRFDGLPTPDRLKLVKAARLNEHMRDAALMGRWYQLFGAGQECAA